MLDHLGSLNYEIDFLLLRPNHAWSSSSFPIQLTHLGQVNSSDHWKDWALALNLFPKLHLAVHLMKSSPLVRLFLTFLRLIGEYALSVAYGFLSLILNRKCPKKPTTQLQRKAAADRAELIPSIPCDPDAEWGIQDEAFKYVTPNVNAYQQRARWDLVLCADKQYQHFTKHFPRDVVQK